MTNRDDPKKGKAPKKGDPEVIKPNQPDTEYSGQEEVTGITVERTEKLLKNHNLDLDKKEPGKRIYRKNKEDLADKTKGPKEEVNRLTQKIGTRISPNHVKLFKACATGFSNDRSALEKAVELLALYSDIKREDYDID